VKKSKLVVLAVVCIILGSFYPTIAADSEFRFNNLKSSEWKRYPDRRQWEKAARDAHSDAYLQFADYFALWKIDGDLSFNARGITFESAESGLSYSGNIEISDRSITVKIHHNENPLEGTKAFDETLTGSAARQKNSCYYSWIIKLSDGSYLASDEYTVPQGENVVIDGIKAVTVGAVNSVATDNVKIRSAPSVNANAYEYSPSIEQGNAGFVPKGTRVKLLARTSAEEKVQTWTNYWYYVELVDSPTLNNHRFAWLFGEFIERPGRGGRIDR
jgi:hypothetical protein